jgi:hypothetical protein
MCLSEGWEMRFDGCVLSMSMLYDVYMYDTAGTVLYS